LQPLPIEQDEGCRKTFNSPPGREQLKFFNAPSILELQANCKANSRRGNRIMRVDLNPSSQPLSETNRGNTPNAAAPANSSASNALGTGEDQAVLSGTLVEAQTLVAQASQLPEVRQERVSALRQAVQSGSYQTSPEQVAGAVFAYMLAGAAA
jgi:flagellar biosynthesis anti-sigma factor FlgM